MAGPVSVDLRRRVVEAVHNGATYREAASRFDVGEASVSRWLALARRHGSLEPKAMGGSVSSFGDDQRTVLEYLVWQAPDATLAELSDQVEKEFGIRVSVSTVSRVLIAMGISRKKSPSSTTAEETPTSSRSVRPSERRR